MELDLSEYDQVDEIKLIREGNNQLYNTGSTSTKFIATLSSCSDQASFDETNYENDFVFLPAPPEQVNSRTQSINPNPQQPVVLSSGSRLVSRTPPQQISPSITRALMVTQTENTSNNPFGNFKQPLHNDRGREEKEHIRHHVTDLNMFGCVKNEGSAAKSGCIQQRSEGCASKPAGLLEVCPNLTSDPNKLVDLMQQIVARSDQIYIAIPCAYCHEQIACLPSDISSWLNHMSSQHNCKLCPVCNKMIGLGPKNEIDIMKRHVLEHLNDSWLERRAIKVSFTFGLQQQWFSGNRCSVKDSRY